MARASAALFSMKPGEPEGWQNFVCVEAFVDSGVGECVCAPYHFAGVRVRDEYVCADGSRMPDMGEKLVQVLTDEGSKFKVGFLVTDVDRPRRAVLKLTAAGHFAGWPSSSVRLGRRALAPDRFSICSPNLPWWR